jgi:hypothetical protein
MKKYLVITKRLFYFWAFQSTHLGTRILASDYGYLRIYDGPSLVAVYTPGHFSAPARSASHVWKVPSPKPLRRLYD